jgi:hypothetical protein
MGYFLGVFSDSITRQDLLNQNTNRKLLVEKQIFPDQPIPDSISWAEINAFYLKYAPEKLPEIPPRKMNSPLPHFEVVLPETRLSPPGTSLVKFINNGQLLIGDVNQKALLVFDQQLNMIRMAKADEGIVWVNEADDAFLLTVMGSFSPTDDPSGYLMALPKKEGIRPLIIIDSLQRPVHTDLGDLNGDGKPDLVISEFSKWTGSFGWWEQTGRNRFKKHILRNKPGATRAFIRDLDQDGKADILALFAQGHEGIFAYFNQGNGKFIEKLVVEFSPSHGSSYLDLQDIDEDGLEDLLYAGGDNADFPPLHRPYHGVRIYRNLGSGNFGETFFYPLYGAYGVQSGDFDLDGDIDLAVISFFPDFKQRPEESFVYLQNQGNFNFEAFTVSDPNLGRWLVLEKGDYDQDGDLDLVLGSLAFEVVDDQNNLVQKWLDDGIPFVVLKNTTR